MKLPALLCALTVGCVSAGEHEELLASHAKLQKELAETKTSLQKESEEKRAAQSQLEAMIAERDRMQKDLEARQTELANVMKDKASLSSSVEDMKKAMDDLARRKAEADKRIAEFRSLLDRFKSLIDAGKLRVKIVEGRMVVELATDVLFSSGSASLSKDGKAAIAEVATVLKDIPDRRFQVEGHTDDVPIRTAQYPSNWELASSRAVNVVKAMVDAGMPVERISAASYGESKPAKPNDTPEGKAANRRIEIVLVPDLSSLPGFEELQKVGR